VVEMSIDEYNVTYAVKEWLIERGWTVVAFNPPGAQGTFTIPNPAKDPQYRGQTGSKSPDIIAVKDSNLLKLIECKPSYNEADVDKLVNLAENKERLDLLLRILSKVCRANDIKFVKRNVALTLGKAHGGKENLLPGIETFHVSISKEWNSKEIETKSNPMDYLTVKYYSPSRISQRKLGSLLEY